MQMKNRFNNLQNNYYDALEYLDPANALSAADHENNPDCIVNVVDQFRSLLGDENDENVIVDSWNSLIFIDDFGAHLTDPNVEIDAFYFGLYDYTNAVGEHPLRQWITFVLNILTIPHSNVEPERVWSKVNLTKTPIRNKLYLSTVNALVQASYCIKNTDCTNFQPSQLMLDCMRNLQ